MNELLTCQKAHGQVSNIMVSQNIISFKIVIQIAYKLTPFFFYNTHIIYHTVHVCGTNGALAALNM